MKKIRVADWDELEPLQPAYALVANVDLVVIRWKDGEEAKIALAQGAELAGTGICSGEGGMLPEEQGANSRYF